MSSVRVLAARVLTAVETRRATLAFEVDRARRGLTDERDRGLLLELTAGVCRWRAELDACLEACSQRPIDTIDLPILSTLRLALYQLRHLERIPVHAVVHESVEAARELEAPRAAGFVNGVLRNYLRTRDAIALPPRPVDQSTRRQHLAYLSVTLSHPRWLVARWLDRYGFEDTERWCQFNNAAPEVSIRNRRHATNAEPLITALADRGIPATQGRYATDVARLAPGWLGSVPLDLRDELMVQDEGSVVVGHAAGARPGERVLDLCAAPGGKSTILWADMAAEGMLVASDVRRPRVELLREILAGAGVPERVLVLDATSSLPFGPDTFDRVFIDVPCSGLGTLRRDPDLKWAATLESLPAFGEAQGRILAQASMVVRPGGSLIYATCSSEPEENDEVVEAFLASSGDFVAEAIEPDTVPAELLDDRGRLRTSPPRNELDAFFAAKLVRRNRA